MVEELYKKFEQKRAEVLKQPEFKEKELTPEQHKEIYKEGVSKRIKTAQPVSLAQEQVVVSSVQQIKIEPKERQIQLLTDLAFEKGIPHAVEVAKRLENAYLLDEFHDALVDKLYNKLIEEGKLKQI